MKHRDAELSGRRAEALAALWLQLKGWTILARRARTPVGEVDLIARRRKVVAFIEVKARTNAEQAGFALDKYRLRRVVAAANMLAPRFVRPGEDVRIDAMFITPRRLPRHLINVWHG